MNVNNKQYLNKEILLIVKIKSRKSLYVRHNVKDKDYRPADQRPGGDKDIVNMESVEVLTNLKKSDEEFERVVNERRLSKATIGNG